jgi:hypothetical protein
LRAWRPKRKGTPYHTLARPASQSLGQPHLQLPRELDAQAAPPPAAGIPAAAAGPSLSGAGAGAQTYPTLFRVTVEQVVPALTGQPLLLRARISPKMPLEHSYQWYRHKEGAPVPLIGQTGPELLIRSANASDTAAYSIEVTVLGEGRMSPKHQVTVAPAADQRQAAPQSPQAGAVDDPFLRFLRGEQAPEATPERG